MANRLEYLLSEIHYCHQCFDSVIGEEWEPHCQAHLDTLTSKRCGTVTYCHTLVRPGYCPFCIGKISLSASERLKPWTRDHKLWTHVKDEHLAGCQWPLVCPHPLCGTPHDDSTSFQFYLIDVHRFSRSRPTKATNSTRVSSPDKNIPLNDGADGAPPCRKRKSLTSSGALEWIPPQSLDSMAAAQEERLSYRPPKRKKQSARTPTICPQVIVINEDMSDDYTNQGVVDSAILSPPIPLSIEDDGKSADLEYGLLPFYCTAPNETVDSLEPEMAMIVRCLISIYAHLHLLLRPLLHRAMRPAS